MDACSYEIYFTGGEMKMSVYSYFIRWFCLMSFF